MNYLRSAIALTAFFALFTGLAFPLLITAVAQASFPHQANGSMVTVQGKVIGSALIGQAFSNPRFFHPRPSSGGYDANNSGGTNLGPLNPKLLEGAEGFDGVRQLAAQYRTFNETGEEVVLPVDAVTRSASGLDPHISPENARLQAVRVARENGLSEEAVASVIAGATTDPFLGLFGERTVNVLMANRRLVELREGQ
jgi:K+-transporting ATPase ATPase C chain